MSKNRLSFMIGQGLIKDIRFFTKNFGIVNAYRFRVRPLLGRLGFHDNYSELQNAAFLHFLNKQLAPVITEYKKRDFVGKPISGDAPIWVCWWQGEANMPSLVKQCYKLLLKNSNGHPVILIDENNYHNYVELPDIILRKVSESKITITHLSDILRVSLLAKHGGLWIDSTYWCTKPLDIAGDVFYTLKQENINTNQIARCRWMGACIGGDSSFAFFSFLRDCLYLYWQKNDALIEYFLLDYLMDIAYNEYPNIKRIIDNNPCRCPDLHIMKRIFNMTFQSDTMQQYELDNCMFKLSWKEKYKMLDSDNNKTYYNYFMSL